MANSELTAVHQRLTRELKGLRDQARQIAEEIAAKEQALEHIKDHAPSAPAAASKPEASA